MSRGNVESRLNQVAQHPVALGYWTRCYSNSGCGRTDDQQLASNIILTATYPRDRCIQKECHSRGQTYNASLGSRWFACSKKGEYSGRCGPAQKGIPAQERPLPALAQEIRPIGVCVTGQARTFALPAVRANFRRFLRANVQHSFSPLVSMILFREESACPGWSYYEKQVGALSDCNFSRAVNPFEMRLEQVQHEFPGAKVAIILRATCQLLRELTGRPFSCCNGQAPAARRLTCYPRALLQFVPAAHCLEQMLLEGTVEWAVRVRPDNLYFKPLPIIRELAPLYPLVARKFDSKVGDWFMVVPNTPDGLNFVRSLTLPLENACESGVYFSKGSWNRGMHPACSFVPEDLILAQQQLTGVVIARKGQFGVAISRAEGLGKNKCWFLAAPLRASCEALHAMIAGLSMPSCSDVWSEAPDALAYLPMRCENVSASECKVGAEYLSDQLAPETESAPRCRRSCRLC